MSPIHLTCLLVVRRVVATIRCVAFVEIASLIILIRPLVASSNNSTSTGGHECCLLSLLVVLINFQEMLLNFSLGIVHGRWGFRKMFVHEKHSMKLKWMAEKGC